MKNKYILINIAISGFILISMAISFCFVLAFMATKMDKELSDIQTELDYFYYKESVEDVEQYGAIAKIFYDTYDHPENKDNVDEILEINGYVLLPESDESYYEDYYVYGKKKVINDKECKFTLSIGKEGSLDHVVYRMHSTYDDINFIVHNDFYRNVYKSKVIISQGEYGSTHINLLTGEISSSSDELIKQSYLNGDYDAYIDEMLSIMENELVLPE